MFSIIEQLECKSMGPWPTRSMAYKILSISSTSPVSCDFLKFA